MAAAVSVLGLFSAPSAAAAAANGALVGASPDAMPAATAAADPAAALLLLSLLSLLLLLLLWHLLALLHHWQAGLQSLLLWKAMLHLQVLARPLLALLPCYQLMVLALQSTNVASRNQPARLHHTLLLLLRQMQQRLLLGCLDTQA